MLGVLPGVLHAWYIIATNPDPTYEQVEDEERGNVTYYYVQGQPQYASAGGRRQAPPQAYGTISNAPNAQFPGQQNGFVQPVAPAPASGSAQPAASSGDVPPTYQEALKGDNKVQGP